MEAHPIPRLEQDNNKPDMHSNVSVGVKLDISPEHVRELCDGIGKNKDLDNIFNATEHLLLSTSLTDTEKNIVLQCMNGAVIQSYEIKRKEKDAKNTSVIILSIGATAFMVLIGGGFFVRQMRILHK